MNAGDPPNVFETLREGWKPGNCAPLLMLGVFDVGGIYPGDPAGDPVMYIDEDEPG